ncbi:hypothetical protein GPJ56_010246 [Histomonas meleagridis]|uniref:uncharacterized protein n=1 Tax=Histomonas meleagridis TaxID=135588 RepID=UPI0035598BF1|nr:hypothetical protein GPJ56_010246 [Histomonas meleagridis]KAH0797114.1 hypothetical protein GO595_011007 [Histomonas meleagridis]
MSGLNIDFSSITKGSSLFSPTSGSTSSTTSTNQTSTDTSKITDTKTSDTSKTTDTKASDTSKAKAGLSFADQIANPFATGKDSQSSGKSALTFSSSGFSTTGKPFNPQGSKIEEFLTSKMAKGTAKPQSSAAQAEAPDLTSDQKPFSTEARIVPISGVHFDLLFKCVKKENQN